MAKNVALSFADSHLRDGAWANRPIKGDSYYALKQIVDIAIKEEVYAVIGAGDLIDKQRNRSAPITFFYKQLDRLQDADIEFWYVQGQHDWDSPSWLSGHRWANHMHKAPIAMLDWVFYGLDFLPAEELAEELARVPEDTDVLIAHQGWLSFMGELTLPQGDFPQVSHATRMVTGDYHHYMLVDAMNAEGSPMKVCSPGSTCLQAIDEPADKFCVLMDYNGKFHKQMLQTRVRIVWEHLLFGETLDKFADEFEAELAKAMQAAAARELPEELTTPLLRITYSHALSDAVRRITAIVGDRAHIFWKELPPEAKAPSSAPKAKEGGAAVTPLSELGKVVDKDEDPELHGLLARLLQAEDGKQELAKWRQEYMAEGEQLQEQES